MLYGQKKVRQMLRSILPSRARKSAREDKAIASRRNRHRVRNALRCWPQDDDDSELMMEIHLSDQKKKQQLHEIVFERRGADKISHFVRWAEQLTAHIPEENIQERYYCFVGHIGGSDGLIKEHAIGHFIDPEYDFNKELSARSRYKRTKLFDRTALAEALQEAFELHPKQLNAALKSDYSLWWKNCEFGEDPCLTRKKVMRTVYTFQTESGIFKESLTKPWSCREGTLVSRREEREEELHDDSICSNRMLVRNQKDVDRIIDRVCKNDTVYDYYYYRDYGLLDRLIDFLSSKHLLEDRRLKKK